LTELAVLQQFWLFFDPELQPVVHGEGSEKLSEERSIWAHEIGYQNTPTRLLR